MGKNIHAPKLLHRNRKKKKNYICINLSRFGYKAISKVLRPKWLSTAATHPGRPKRSKENIQETAGLVHLNNGWLF